MARPVCLALAGVVHPRGGELIGAPIAGVVTFLEILLAHGWSVELVTPLPEPAVRAWLLVQGLNDLVAGVRVAPIKGAPLLAPDAIAFSGSYPEAWTRLQAWMPYPDSGGVRPQNRTAAGEGEHERPV